MFAASKTAVVSGAGPDAQFNYVTMLLHGDGTNGAQNNTFLDSSNNTFTITRNGNTTQGSFSPYGSNWSNFFGGSPSYLSLSATPAQFGTSDFTVECWINPNSVASVGSVISLNPFASNGWAFGVGFPSSGDLYWYANGAAVLSYSGIAVGVWTHVAVSRSGSTIRMFVNGTLTSSATDSINYNSSTGTYIGADLSAQYFNGYVSNIRLVKGTAVYTSSFTPSTTPLTAITNTSLLTCQSNRFVDNSASPLTITVNGTPSVQRFNPFGTSTAYSTSVIGGSGYFDGSGDYLQVANDSAFDFSGDFTVECWLYLANTNNQTFISKGGHNALGPDAAGWALFIYTGQGLRFMTRNSGGTNVPVTVASTPQINTWMHVAVSRSGSSMKAFLNGTLVSTVTSSVNTANSSPFNIGANLNNLSPSTGYICDVRIIKGTAQYTATFTPPTAPLTAITDTQFLENFTNGAIFDNSMMNDLETEGNAQISTSVKKFGTGSLAFDGTGDILKIPFSPNLTMQGDFTAECWVYVTSAPQAYGGILAFSNDSENVGWNILIGGNTSKFHFNVAMTYTDTATSLTLNTWTHLALVRSGSTGKLYINGVADSNTVTTSATATCPTNPQIGRYPLISDRNFFGYIDDVRITKGFARYTTNFTPPTAAFSDTGPY